VASEAYVSLKALQFGGEKKRFFFIIYFIKKIPKNFVSSIILAI
jgi:hypothetical protein